jgi:type I site-specific restriction endonuclease
MRTKQAQNILFLADRDALVDQTLTDGFKAHLPNEPRDRIYTQRIDTSKRLFVATLQTMNICFEKFSPGFFDLIIFDEAHRSIFNRFSEVIEYFDARMIGLTATPMCVTLPSLTSDSGQRAQTPFCIAISRGRSLASRKPCARSLFGRQFRSR